MIYILTSGEYDLSTDHVIQWLNYYNANYIRINVEELENSKLTKVYIDSHNNLTDITYKDHKIKPPKRTISINSPLILLFFISPFLNINR